MNSIDEARKSARRAETKPAGSMPMKDTSQLRILLADDHEIVRHGVRGLIEARGWDVVGEAKDGREALDMVQSLKPDIVILDIAMPRLNGLEVTRQIRKTMPDCRILILTMHDSEQMVRSILGAGAMGYVLKSDAAQHLVLAIEALAHDGSFLTPRVSQMVLESYRSGVRVDTGGAEPPREELTVREAEVLQLLAEGRSNKEVATELGISVKTAETHRSNLMLKLGLHSISDLIHYAIRNKLIEP